MSSKTKKSPTHSLNLLEKTLNALKNAGSLISRVEGSFQGYKRAFHDWLVKLVVTGLSVFTCLVFLVLGLFFLIIDYGGIPRGVVFTCGGLLGLLVLRWMEPSTK